MITYCLIFINKAFFDRIAVHPVHFLQGTLLYERNFFGFIRIQKS